MLRLIAIIMDVYAMTKQNVACYKTSRHILCISRHITCILTTIFVIAEVDNATFCCWEGDTGLLFLKHAIPVLPKAMMLPFKPVEEQHESQSLRHTYTHTHTHKITRLLVLLVAFLFLPIKSLRKTCPLYFCGFNASGNCQTGAVRPTRLEPMVSPVCLAVNSGCSQRSCLVWRIRIFGWI